MGTVYTTGEHHAPLHNRGRVQPRNLTVIWEEPRRHPSRQRITKTQSPHWLQWDAPHLPPKLPLPFNILHLHPSHPFLDQRHSPPQMASRSNQPLCHCTPSGQTDRPTDRWSVPRPAYALYTDYSDAAKKVTQKRDAALLKMATRRQGRVQVFNHRRGIVHQCTC